MSVTTAARAEAVAAWLTAVKGPVAATARALQGGQPLWWGPSET